MGAMKKRWKIIFLICLISLLLAGCVKRIEITDQSIKCGKMKTGQSYTAPMDGWFVSDEGVAKILKAVEYFKYKWLECEGSK